MLLPLDRLLKNLNNLRTMPIQILVKNVRNSSQVHSEIKSIKLQLQSATALMLPNSPLEKPSTFLKFDFEFWCNIIHTANSEICNIQKYQMFDEFSLFFLVKFGYHKPVEIHENVFRIHNVLNYLPKLHAPYSFFFWLSQSQFFFAIRFFAKIKQRKVTFNVLFCILGYPQSTNNNCLLKTNEQVGLRSGYSVGSCILSDCYFKGQLISKQNL